MFQGNLSQTFSLGPKKNNKIRVILNLKQFNENIDPLHFKIETLQCAINSMRKDCYFGSVDLSKSYYSIPVTKSTGSILGSSLTIKNMNLQALLWDWLLCHEFSPVLKPVFAYLREKGYMSTAYIDDSHMSSGPDIPGMQ